MLLVLLFVIACSTPLSVSSVDPDKIAPGGTLKVLGEGFADGASAYLVPAGGGSPVAAEELKVLGAVVMEVTTPGDIGAGEYDVSVEVGGKTSKLSKAVTVEAPKEDVPCNPDVNFTIQVSQERKEIAFDRMYLREKREVFRITLREVQQVEYEIVPVKDGKCHVVYLRTTDGRRIIFSDELDEDLKDFAWALSRDLGKPAVEIK